MKKSRFLGLFVIWSTFLLMLAIVLFVGRNIAYSPGGKVIDILKESRFSGKSVEEEDPETLILYQGSKDGKKGKNEMAATIKQMKIPCDKKSLTAFSPEMLDDYEKLVLVVTDYEKILPFLPAISDWVMKGNSLLFAIPFELKGNHDLEDIMGIRELPDNEWAVVKGFRCVEGFMPGGTREMSISTPYESSLRAELKKGCDVYMSSTDENEVPLIWKRDYGQGEVVVDNLGFMEKAYRGFHCAAYTLMGDYAIWPVINGSVFYIDDFPSPVPPGDSFQIREDYNMDIKDFYTQIWWRDVSNLARKYNYPYTGLVIEMYSNQVSGEFPRQKDTTRFEYFGNMLLDSGGELGLHGYNHMPLVLENFDYLNKYESYHQWQSREDITNALDELLSFCHELFPTETFPVYVPPSNIISEEGREILAEDFPEVKCIASLYLPDQNDVSFATNFEITDDGLIQTPRITSGYVLEDYMRTAAISELYLHCVNTHFQHPDDVLDVDRGANLGWEELFGRFEDYVDWLYSALPEIRSLKGSELAGAVQRYDHVKIQRKNIDHGIRVSLGEFADEAWFYLRLNSGKPSLTDGGTMKKVAEDLYLVRATSSELNIRID